MPILKLEPYSGISGDMFLGALAPLLQAEEAILSLPKRLGLPGVAVSFSDVRRSSIQCRKATVSVHGHAVAEHGHDHGHGVSHGHGHGHGDHHGHHHHADSAHHAHRAHADIARMIRAADLTPGTKDLALRLFEALGRAESEMHGIPLEQVHFHEVGAEDSILDLVGAALLIDQLQPTAVYCGPVCVGSGFVKTAHGRLPVPAPATHRLLEGMPTFAGPIALEMTTPTGAAILKVLGVRFESPVLVVDRSNMGAGSRDLDQPNALRASLCRDTGSTSERVTLLQTNLDNLGGELLGADLLGDFLEAGALDAWLSPILMKKGRPAHVLEVLCHEGQAEVLTAKILGTLPTLGVRRFDGNRTVLPRGVVSVETPYGKIDVKVHHLDGGKIRHQPEYASCRLAALAHGVAVNEVYQSVWSRLAP